MLSMFFPPLDLSGFVLVQDFQCTRKLLRVVSRHFLCKYSNFIGDISHFFQLENSKWLSRKSEGKLHYISWILKGGEEVTKPSAYKKTSETFYIVYYSNGPRYTDTAFNPDLSIHRDCGASKKRSLYCKWLINGLASVRRKVIPGKKERTLRLGLSERYRKNLTLGILTAASSELLGFTINIYFFTKKNVFNLYQN